MSRRRTRTPAYVVARSLALGGALGLMLNVALAGEEVAATVKIKDFAFHPAEITVKKGDTVRWLNTEKRQYHSVWFEEAGDPEPDYFFPEESFERTFDTTGTFSYRCGPHPKMRGVVRVVD